MTDSRLESKVSAAIVAVFALLAAGFALELFGGYRPLPENPLVDPSFLETKTWRASYADKVAAEEEVFEYDCYFCHEEKKKLELTFDDKGAWVRPEEHENIKMGHGTHGRNNNCFNCHDQENMVLLQPRDGTTIEMQDSSRLCGSCHGPTQRDWQAGIHGRTSGHWDREKGEFQRLNCVNCHDPHSPQFPGRAPAPPPNYLRKVGKQGSHQDVEEGAEQAEESEEEAESSDEAEPEMDDSEESKPEAADAEKSEPEAEKGKDE